jgi:carboxymethylenebutenolidase
MPTSQVILDTPDGEMPTYTATPEGPSRGGVVVIQEAFGAAAGWSAVAPALFHRQGSPAAAYDEMAAVRPLMMALTAEGISMDVDAAFGYLASLGFPPPCCAIVGFCMGGSVTFMTAVRLSVGAAATFYGGGIAEGRFGYPPELDVAAELQTPWIGLYGDLDKGIPSDDVEKLRKITAGAKVPTQVVRYADADHGFHCDDRPSVFHEEAAADAWGKALAWFDRYVAAD